MTDPSGGGLGSGKRPFSPRQWGCAIPSMLDGETPCVVWRHPYLVTPRGFDTGRTLC